MLNYYDSFDCEIQSDEFATEYEEREKVLEELKPYKEETARNGGYSRTYNVYNVPAEWDDNDLINFCDPCNFGGCVYSRNKQEQKAWVEVYTD